MYASADARNKSSTLRLHRCASERAKAVPVQGYAKTCETTERSTPRFRRLFALLIHGGGEWYRKKTLRNRVLAHSQLCTSKSNPHRSNVIRADSVSVGHAHFRSLKPTRRLLTTAGTACNYACGANCSDGVTTPARKSADLKHRAQTWMHNGGDGSTVHFGQPISTHCIVLVRTCVHSSVRVGGDPPSKLQNRAGLALCLSGKMEALKQRTFMLSLTASSGH